MAKMSAQVTWQFFVNINCLYINNSSNGEYMATNCMPSTVNHKYVNPSNLPSLLPNSHVTSTLGNEQGTPRLKYTHALPIAPRPLCRSKIVHEMSLWWVLVQMSISIQPRNDFGDTAVFSFDLNNLSPGLKIRKTIQVRLPYVRYINMRLSTNDM